MFGMVAKVGDVVQDVNLSYKTVQNIFRKHLVTDFCKQTVHGKIFWMEVVAAAVLSCKF